MDMTIRGLKRRFVGTAMALALAIPAHAIAADMDAIPQDAFTVVEYGSGWYLRGDVGVNFHGPFDDTGVEEQFLSNDAPINASIAMGYTFNDYFRMEAELGYVGNYSFSDSYSSSCTGFFSELQTIGGNTFTIVTPGSVECEGNDDGENNLWNGLVNGYFDLGNYSGFRPYVGAGLGFLVSNYNARVNQRNCVDTNIGTSAFTCQPAEQVDAEFNDTSVSLLWSLTGGFAYDLDENWAVDVGYRYLSATDATYLTGGNAGGPGEATGVSVQQVRVGLRYSIW
jgi:opacity protein-like surface antigen